MDGGAAALDALPAAGPDPFACAWDGARAAVVRPAELPAGFTTRLREKPERGRPRSAGRRRWVVAQLGWALAAAAALLLALLGTHLGQVNGELLRQRQDDARIAALLSRPDVV